MRRYTGGTLDSLRTYAYRRGFRLQKEPQGFSVIDKLDGQVVLRSADRETVAAYLKRFAPYAE